MNESLKQPEKRSWQRPTLQVYGSIGALTNLKGMTNGLADSSGGASDKKTQ
jgi:hypothetical protein